MRHVADLSNFEFFVTFFGFPEIEKVIFNDPATIVYWKDGVKTVVKCSEYDEFNKLTGLAMAICKRYLGYEKYKSIFKEWSYEK